MPMSAFVRETKVEGARVNIDSRQTSTSPQFRLFHAMLESLDKPHMTSLFFRDSACSVVGSEQMATIGSTTVLTRMTGYLIPRPHSIRAFHPGSIPMTQYDRLLLFQDNRILLETLRAILMAGDGRCLLLLTGEWRMDLLLGLVRHLKNHRVPFSLLKPSYPSSNEFCESVV